MCYYYLRTKDVHKNFSVSFKRHTNLLETLQRAIRNRWSMIYKSYGNFNAQTPEYAETVIGNSTVIWENPWIE